MVNEALPPVFGWILWLLGLILSFVGVFKSPKGLAIAGLVISLLGLILLIMVLGEWYLDTALGALGANPY
jgi:hypothetical protein